MRVIYLALLFLSFFFSFKRAEANERKFTYTYETSTLPPGAREIEIWNTYRSDKGFYYRALDQRIEFEFGLVDNLMASLYLNTSSRLQDSNGNADGGNPAFSQDISISSEWKYKLMDRVVDPFGFAVYGEATLGLDETELEGKLLFDKQIDKFLFAFNAAAEQGWENELEDGTINRETELQLEFDCGGTYFITREFSMGLEIRNHNEIKDGQWEHSALFLGPSLSYTAENWWAAVTVLPQVTSFKGATMGNLVLNEHEKIESRLLFSMSL